MTREEILADAEKRMVDNTPKYGTFRPERDSRDMIEERIMEQLDAINYSIMDIQKLSYVRDVAGIRIEVKDGRLSVSMKAIPEGDLCQEA